LTSSSQSAAHEIVREEYCPTEPTVVRTGPLTIPAGSFPTAPGDGNPFSAEFPYAPVCYTGGNFLIEIRHTGSNIVNTAADLLEDETGVQPYAEALERRIRQFAGDTPAPNQATQQLLAALRRN